MIKITQNFEISSYQQGFGVEAEGETEEADIYKIAFEIKTNNTNLPISFTFSLFWSVLQTLPSNEIKLSWFNFAFYKKSFQHSNKTIAVLCFFFS